MTLSVRPFVASDAGRLRAICHQTVVERPFLPYVDDTFFASAFYLDPYLQLESESCFVAEYEGRVVAYLAGTCDTRRFQAKRVRYYRRNLPSYCAEHCRASLAGNMAHSRSHRLLASIYLKILSGRFQDAADIGRIIDLERYPAHCHLQVAPEARDKRAGLALILKFHEYLKAKGVPGQHSSLVEEVGREGYSRMLKALRFKTVRENTFTNRERPNLVHLGTWRECLLIRDF